MLFRAVLPQKTTFKPVIAPNLFSFDISITLLCKLEIEKCTYPLHGKKSYTCSGCTQHMTGDARMFNSINTNGNDDYDSIVFGDNGKARSRGLVRLQYLMT